jgi:hypothetical protein
MSDREATVRARVCEIFAPFADCASEAALTDGGRVDVLLRPRRGDLNSVSIAIECKDPQRTIGDARLGRWLKQCGDYVGAAPANGWPPVVAGFAWLVDQPLDPRQEERTRMAGMIMLAAHFRVGWATGDAWPFDIARSYCSRLARLGVTLSMSLSAEIFRLNRGGFTESASAMLRAHRQYRSGKAPWAAQTDLGAP